MTRTKSKKRRISSRRRLRSKRLQRGGVVLQKLKLRKNQKDIRVFELTDEGLQWLPGAKVSLGRLLSKKKSFAGKYRFISYANILKISPLDFVRDTYANTFTITYQIPSGRKTLTLDNLCYPCPASVNVPDLVKNFYDKLKELKDLERTGPRKITQVTDEAVDDIFQELGVYEDVYGPQTPSRSPSGGSKRRNKRKRRIKKKKRYRHCNNRHRRNGRRSRIRNVRK